MDDAKATIIAAVITVIGVALTAIFTYMQFKKQQWNETVVKEREKWLKSFRDELGNVMLAYELLASNNFKGCNNCDVIKKGIKSKYILISRLNTNSVEGNEYNFEYKELLNKLQFSPQINFKEFDPKRFIELSNLILEREWQKVKEETDSE